MVRESNQLFYLDFIYLFILDWSKAKKKRKGMERKENTFFLNLVRMPKSDAEVFFSWSSFVFAQNLSDCIDLFSRKFPQVHARITRSMLQWRLNKCRVAKPFITTRGPCPTPPCTRGPFTAPRWTSARELFGHQNTTRKGILSAILNEVTPPQGAAKRACLLGGCQACVSGAEVHLIPPLDYGAESAECQDVRKPL